MSRSFVDHVVGEEVIGSSVQSSRGDEVVDGRREPLANVGELRQALRRAHAFVAVAEVPFTPDEAAQLIAE